MIQYSEMNLKETVEVNPNQTLPRQFHEKTNQILDPSDNLIRTKVNKLGEYNGKHKMKIDKSKSNLMLLNH